MAVSYPSIHLLMRLNGHFGTIVGEFIDYWSVGLRAMLGSGTLDETNKVGFLNTIQTPVQQFHTSNFVAAPDNCWLDNLTAAYIGTDGKYVGGDSQPTTRYIYATPPKGAQGASFPFSQARVFTLDTNLDRGRGAKGRFYYPNATGVDATGRWTATQCAQAADAAHILLDSINGALQVVWGPGAHLAVLTTMGSGEVGTITRVGVGRAPDTQRRRDNRVLEQHSYIDLSTAAGAREEVATRVYDAS